MPNPYYVEQADYSLGIDKAIGGVLKGAEIRKQNVQTSEDEQAMSAFSENFENMTPVEVGQYVLKNPRVAKYLISAVDTTNKMTKQENLDSAIAIAQAYLSGDQTAQAQPGQPQVQPVQPPAVAQPMIGLDSGPVSPVAPLAAPGAPVGPGQLPAQEDSQVSGARDAAVQILSGQAQEVLNRGGDAKESIELTRDAMTGGERAFKGAMAYIAANDPQAFDRLMKLQGGETTPATDIDDYVSRANEESIRLTGEPLTPGGKNKAALEFKRMQAGEARTVTTAKKTAELDVISQMQPGIDRDKAITVYQAGQEEKRNQTAIDNGLIAAESMPNIKRGLDLLKGIETGGFDNAKLAAKRFFGVEGADEGELSNRLAKAVLSQLRTTFGAQFTEGEGQRLIRIEAGFDKSPENNQRLLNQALLMAQGKVDIAVKIAESKGDQSAIDQIKSWTDFDLGAGATSTPEVSTKAEYDALAPGAFYMEDGKKYQKPGGQ